MNAHTSDGTMFDVHAEQDNPCVVLIHGLGLNQDVWRWQLDALKPHYCVLTYDLYGHGNSANPTAIPSLSLFSEQLAGVMDHCGVRDAAIIGFSLGGMIARRFAQDMPERVTALGILNSPHKRTPEAQAAILKRVEQAREEGTGATVEAALERWFTAPFRAANPDMMALVRTWVLANDKAVYHTIYQVLADGIDEIVAPNPPISCPSFVLTGDEDYGNGPEMSAAIAADIAGAECCILKGLRHMALAENPAAVNVPLLAFLKRTL
ncbi:MAG: alpha/beta fold hydrolase [Hyphomicrobiales bacterium]